MRFVRDGEDGACVASLQVSTPQPDEAAEPAYRAGLARAAAVAAAWRTLSRRRLRRGRADWVWEAPGGTVPPAGDQLAGYRGWVR